LSQTNQFQFRIYLLLKGNTIDGRLYVISLIKTCLYIRYCANKLDTRRSGPSAIPLNFREWSPKRQSAFPTIDVKLYLHRGIIGARKLP